MAEIRVPFSPGALAAYEEATTAWAEAMKQLPAHLANRLNVHQIDNIPAVSADADRGFGLARGNAGVQGSVNHTLDFSGGTPAHVYRWA